MLSIKFYRNLNTRTSAYRCHSAKWLPAVLLVLGNKVQYDHELRLHCHSEFELMGTAIMVRFCIMILYCLQKDEQNCVTNNIIDN